MPIRRERRERPPTRLEAQVNLILHGIPGVVEGLPDSAAWPRDWDEKNEVNYLYRRGSILCRDSDIERVQAHLPATPADHDNNLRGLTRLEFSPKLEVDDVCTNLDRVLGEGVVTPDHIFYLCPTNCCPATEPEEVAPDAPPDPRVSTQPCTGEGAQVAVLDNGWLKGTDTLHYWLEGVDGEEDHAFGGNPRRILPYGGHGTFVAGVLRTMAPRADVYVYNTFPTVGAAFESDIVKDASEALQKGADIISIEYGTNTRKDIHSLGFDVLGELLRHHPSTALVAAAGCDGSRRKFWPAAFPWAISVGALSANWRSRAEFSNFGPWVDVYAPGEELVNAFATGDYKYIEPPNVDKQRHFAGMARWSGTSFSTPLFAGLIAARMSDTGETGPRAAAALLARARAQYMHGLGPVIFPGQACDDQDDRCCCHRGHAHGGSCCCH